MANHYQPRSKGTWGKEEAKTAEELNRLCNDFFEKLVVPLEWNCMGWANVFDPQHGLLSVGKKFRDMRTSGIDMMEYRVCFFTFSQRGGVVKKSIIDFGKYDYKSVDHGVFTVDKLNEFIKSRYNELEEKDSNPSAALVPLQGDIDENDGLQSFRDRFGNRMADKI